MDEIERRTQNEQQDRNDIPSNEQSVQSHLRPIPGVFPRYPNVVNETFPSIVRNEGIDNFSHLVPQIGSPLEGQPHQVPYFTTIVQPVGLAVASNIQPAQPRIIYAQQPVQGIAFRPYINQVYCPAGVSPQLAPYQYGVRYASQARDSQNSIQQNYRAKPGSVYGIPPAEPQRLSAPVAWDNRSYRPYDLLLQPEAMRVFNDYKNRPPSPKDRKPEDKTSKFSESNKSRNSEVKPNGTVHIGGILTLPKHAPTYEEDSSQNSTGSSIKDDELKPPFLQPGIMLFRKLAQAGFKDLKRTIVKYGVKSSKADLETLCEEVRADLRTQHTGVLQIEPVLREIILAYIRICGSWSSLVSVLPMMREHPHPLEDCLNPLIKEFSTWQDVSTTMLQRILDALDVLPTEHERCISGLARSSEPRSREPGEDGDFKEPSEDLPDFGSANPLDMTIGYSPLPGYVYQTYPGCDNIQLTVPKVELSPNLQQDDPIWAHLYPQLDSE